MSVDISIVLPVFNGENTIIRSLESIANQTFTNFEVVIINDGSTDGTRPLVEEFCKTDRRFNLINIENSGVANARQTGLSHSNGKYIIHHDADDSRPPDSLASLYKLADESGADIVMGDYSVVNGKNLVRVSQSLRGSSDELMQDLINGKIHGGLWNKLVKRELCKRIGFVNAIDYMEDKLFLIRVLLDSPTVAYLPQSVYNYHTVSGSITNTISSQRLGQIREVIEIVERDINASGKNYDLTSMKLQYKLLAVLNNIYIDSKNIFPEVNHKIFAESGMSIRHKILLFLEVRGFRAFSNLYQSLKNL